MSRTAASGTPAQPTTTTTTTPSSSSTRQTHVLTGSTGGGPGRRTACGGGSRLIARCARCSTTGVRFAVSWSGFETRAGGRSSSIDDRERPAMLASRTATTTVEWQGGEARAATDACNDHDSVNSPAPGRLMMVSTGSTSGGRALRSASGSRLIARSSTTGHRERPAKCTPRPPRSCDQPGRPDPRGAPAAVASAARAAYAVTKVHAACEPATLATSSVIEVPMAVPS